MESYRQAKNRCSDWRAAPENSQEQQLPIDYTTPEMELENEPQKTPTTQKALHFTYQKLLKEPLMRFPTAQNQKISQQKQKLLTAIII